MTITPTGQQILRDLVARRKKILSALFEILDPREQDTYLKATEKLVAHLFALRKRAGDKNGG